jgi:hypothetical protein
MHGGGHGGGSPLAGLLLALLAAVLFAVGAVLQHEAADLSRTPSGLSLRRLVKRRRWMLGQAATLLGTGTQVAALAVAPVAVVQPMLAVGLVVALGVRALRTRMAPVKVELIGAALTTGGLAVFLLAAQPQQGPHLPPPSSVAVIAAVVVSIALVAGATLFGHGAHGALACGAAAGIAAGIGAVLISVGVRSLQEGGWVHALAGVAVGGRRRGGGRRARWAAGLCPGGAGLVAAGADPAGPPGRRPRGAAAARGAPGAGARRGLDPSRRRGGHRRRRPGPDR